MNTTGKKETVRAIIVTTLLMLLSATSAAQQVRYVSDKQYVPLRSGAGNGYRIIHRGIPSGTRMTVSSTSPDGEWSQITTAKGTKGWIRTQYLMREMPAALKVDEAVRKSTAAIERSAKLAEEVKTLKAERSSLNTQVNSKSSDFDKVSNELSELKKISSKAVQLDSENRRLVEDSENLHSEVEMLKAENQRLEDKLRNEDFINGALAVLLGVIIALVAPRLMPKKRRSSGWA
jgi:SH3 domain protein